MSQILRDFCIVKVKSVFRDETKFKGLNGMQILMSVIHNPQKHTMNCGIVTSVPTVLTQTPIIWEYYGIPSCEEVMPKTFKPLSDVKMEVRVGDKICFNYNSLLPNKHTTLYNHRFLSRKMELDENGIMYPYLYFKINYQSIFAAIRYEPINPESKPFDWHIEGKLIPIHLHGEPRYQHEDSLYKKTVQMIGSWTFIEPDKESWDDITRHIPVMLGDKQMLDETGQPKTQPLIVKSMPTQKYLVGWVRYVGSPLKGDDLEVSPGEYVMYRPATDTPVEFEGVEYHRMLQRNIVASFPLKTA